jgi:hypothetical protein
MKTKFIFVFMLAAFSVFSQEWAPQGATWYFSSYAPYGDAYLRVQYVRDTVILEKNCKILEKIRFHDYYFTCYDEIWTGDEYTYYENGEVYYYEDDQFYMLYDFNAIPGDEWDVNYQGTLGRVMVDSIGTVIINDRELKWIAVSTVDGYCAGWFSSKIYETLGNWIFLFPGWFECIVDGEEAAGLRCYSDNTFGFYKNPWWDHECDYILTNLPEQSSNLLIQAYPNPCNDQLSLSFGDQYFYNKFCLVNSLNEVVFEEKFINRETVTINTEAFKAGIYYLKVTDSNGSISFQKIVVI